jgi:hypothetical protein
LVVCPVIALTQWKTEIEKFTDGSLTICTYHGPDRESQTPREMLKKYDVVLTTYQVVEADFRKMTSPNRVECPNCGGKFKLDKLPIHLKYFCGETAQKTEAQARQRRNSDNDRPRGRRGRRPDRPFGKNSRNDKDKKDAGTSESKHNKQSKKMPAATKKANTGTKKASTKETSKPPSKKGSGPKKKLSDLDEEPVPVVSRPSRNAARKAASQITKSAAEWMPPDDDSDSEAFKSETESLSADDSDVPEESSESDSDSDNSALQRARAKQQQALERARKSKGKKSAASKGGKKTFAKNGKKKFDDDFDDDDSSSDNSNKGGPENDIDMDALVTAAMEGGKKLNSTSGCRFISAPVVPLKPNFSCSQEFSSSQLVLVANCTW